MKEMSYLFIANFEFDFNISMGYDVPSKSNIGESCTIYIVFYIASHVKAFPKALEGGGARGG